MLVWIITAAFLIAIYAIFIERHWLDIRRIRLSIPYLPESFKNLTIVLFSDTHIGFFYQPKHLARLIKRVNELNPDVICFTGDLLNDHTSLNLLEPSIQLLAQLKAPLGKVAVLGNHDYHAGFKETKLGLKKAGFTLLLNQHTTISIGTDQLTFIGLDDMLYGKPDLLHTLLSIPADRCKILLIHEPDFAKIPSPVPIPLQLSGHSHGGQVRVPFIGPILTTRYGINYPGGLDRGVNGLVYTTRGIGTTHLPLRFCCRPELTLISLTKENG